MENLSAMEEEDLKFTLIHQMRPRQMVDTECNISSNGTHFAYINRFHDILVAELNCGPDKLPYASDIVKMSQKCLHHKLLPKETLNLIYNGANLLERQEFALGDLGVVQPKEAKVVQTEWSAPNWCHGETILAILFSDGVCRLFTKSLETNREWQNIATLNSYFKEHPNNMWTPNIHKIKTLSDLKEFTKSNITAVCWHKTEHILYAANRAGYILCFKFDISKGEFTLLCSINPDLSNIEFLSVLDDFLVISDKNGVVHLYQTKDFEKIEFISSLWNNRDRLICRKALITFNENTNSYNLLFIKAAFVIAFVLSTTGKILLESLIPTNGIKITGIDSLSANEFIITNVTKNIHYLRLNTSENNFTHELKVINIDVGNFKSFGLVASPNRNLWTFMLFREHKNLKIKTHKENVYFNIYKVNRYDSLTILSEQKIVTMNPYRDCIIAVTIDTMNNTQMERYRNFCNTENLNFEDGWNDILLHKMQIMLLLIEKAIKYGNVPVTANRLRSFQRDILILAIEFTHITCRLQHIFKTNSLDRSAIQQQLINYFITKAKIILNKANSIKEESPLRNVIEKFENLASDTLEGLLRCSEHVVEWTENCFECDESVSPESMTCDSNHDLFRCSISYLQMPALNRFCPQCFRYVIDDDTILQQLYGPDEAITCIFCGLNFVWYEL